MTKIYVAKRVIDYVGLLARGIPESTLAIDETMAPVLALVQGMGSDGAKLISVDANGNLQVSLAGAALAGQVRIQGNLATDLATVGFPGDGFVGGEGVQVLAQPELFNNATYDRWRSASQANLASATGLGAALTATPGQWAQFSQAGAGVQATTSRGAVAGTRHVCTSVDFSAVAAVAPVATVMTINLRDGASGAGTILRSWLVFIAAAIGTAVAPFGLSGLNIVGSVNTAMTLEWNALLANLQQSVSMSGYDGV